MSEKQHTCPVWVGYLMASRLRKIHQNPHKILSPYITKGMKILELGPALGFFSIPLARLTGESGKVYCVDIQENMLDKLGKRAEKYHVRPQIELVQSNSDSFNIEHLKEHIDFALLFYVIHELPDQDAFFDVLYQAMKKNAKALFVEPKGHVNHEKFENSIEAAVRSGFISSKAVNIAGSRSIVLKK